MDVAKATGWFITGLFILLAFWLGSLVLGIGLSILNAILSVIGAVVGAIFSLIFSKNFITLAAVGLVAYLFFNRNKDDRRFHGYHY